MNRRFRLITLGCSKNIADSQRIVSLLEIHGFRHVSEWGPKPDFVIVNSCAFTLEARRATETTISQIVSQEHHLSSEKIILVGCYANYKYRQKWIGSASNGGVDAIVQFDHYKELPYICESLLGEKKRVEKHDTSIEAGSYQQFLEIIPIIPASSQYSAILKISEGCSLKCSFCSIPGFRGPQRSRFIESIVAEARSMVEQGAVELNLVAQETASYGLDIYGSPHLVELLESLLTNTNASWIRVSYCYPTFVSDSLIDLFASEPRLMPYFDIPLQHINDHILCSMNRGYRRKAIELLLEKIFNNVPQAQVITSFIAGFPGETNEAFKELLAFIGQGWFRYVNVFPFSPEPGTPSYMLKNQLDEDIKSERVRDLRKTQHIVFNDLSKTLIGQKIDVLVCGPNTDFRTLNKYPYRARTIWDAPEDSHICLKHHHQLNLGEIIPARVISSEGYVLYGEGI